MKNLGSFSITPAESRDFARASGDFNPLHLDPVAARRTRFGQTLIHGECGTVKALDLLWDAAIMRDLLPNSTRFLPNDSSPRCSK